jgi:hypothetical protein
VHRARNTKKAHFLIQQNHPLIEQMRIKTLQSLTKNADHNYRNNFCNHFPHFNEERVVSDEETSLALDKCVKILKETSNFCELHCG